MGRNASKINVNKLMDELKKSESRPGARTGSFKIDVPFEQAVKKIAKAKPEPKKRKAKPHDKRS